MAVWRPFVYLSLLFSASTGFSNRHIAHHIAHQTTNTHLTRQFNQYVPPIRSTTSSLWASAPSDDGDNTAWIKKAMGNEGKPKLFMNRPLNGGVAGFAVDATLGFVVVLAESPSLKAKTNQRACHAVVSHVDKVRLESTESLCLVQLSGSIDVGAAIFPPDALARLVIDDDDAMSGIHGQLVLEGIEAVWKESETTKISKEMATENEMADSIDRTKKIEQDAPKLMEAIQKLPGLTSISQTDVISAMKLHADINGEIARTSFLNVLETLREQSSSPNNDINIHFYARIINRITQTKQRILVPSTFLAIALSLRHGIKVEISDDCLEQHGYDTSEVSERFPAFRPIHELSEDAKVMDAFIPSMFFGDNNKFQ